MKPYIIRVILFTALFFVNLCSAGTRPLNVVFINIGEYDLYKSKFYEKWINNELADKSKPSHCWGRLLGNGIESSIFSLISRTHRPDGLDQEMGRKIWGGNVASAKIARKILSKNFEYEPGEFVGYRGYDGMYILNSDGKELTMMSVGTHGGVSKKITMKMDETHPAQTASDFSYSLCAIADPVMAGYGA